MKVLKIDHLGIAVNSIDQGKNFWMDVLGLKFEGTETVEEQKVTTAFFPVGESEVELLESTAPDGPISKYLEKKGEGIQHIAVGTREVEIYDAVDAIAARGLRFMPKPPQSYYELSRDRVPGHEEPLDRMEEHGILIDGEGVVDGGETRILLQIFSKTVIGPIFFEDFEDPSTWASWTVPAPTWCCPSSSTGR